MPVARVTSLATNKQRLAASYDVAPYVALARKMAGIEEKQVRSVR